MHRLHDEIEETYLINFGGKEYGRFKILDICQGATGKEESQFKKNLESKLHVKTDYEK